MKVKIEDLSDRALDWAVEHQELARLEASGEYIKPWWRQRVLTDPRRWSSEWLIGGPIIEREKIELKCRRKRGTSTDEWLACPRHNRGIYDKGRTALIAAMRCYLSDCVGDEIDVPEILL